MGELNNAKKFAGGKHGGGYIKEDDGYGGETITHLSSEGTAESLIKDQVSGGKDLTTSGSYSYLKDKDFNFDEGEKKDEVKMMGHQKEI